MKKLALFSLLLLVASFAIADIYTIGTGTTATSTNPYYGLYNFSWSKIIYTQAEINAAGLTTADNIIGVGFYVGNTPANYEMAGQRVYARHTTATMYDTADIAYPGTTGFTLVFEGDLTYNGGGWHYLDFATPFPWNASENIEFLFENWDADLPTGYPTFRYTSTSTTYLTVYKGQDASFPSDLTGTRTYTRANIQLVTAQTTPPQPAVVVYPLDGGTLISPTTALRWISNDGFPDGYRIFLGTNNPPTNLLNNEDLGYALSYNPDPDLLIDTTYYWQIVPYNQFGEAANCPVWSFTTHGDATISELPYLQHWDAVTAPTMPFDWIALLQTTATAAYIYTNTTNSLSAPNNAVMFNSTDLTGELLLISPPLDPSIPVNTTRAHFWARPGGSNYTLSVGVISDPADPSTYQEMGLVTLPVSTAYAEYTVSMAAYTGTGNRIAFRHPHGGSGRTIRLDDVQIELIAQDDLACTALLGNTTPSVNAATTFTATIYNWGSVSQAAYTVKLFDSANVELATATGITCAPGVEVQVPLVWTPTVQGPATIYAKVFLAGDQNTTNDQSPNLNITVQPAGTTTVTVGIGNLAEGIPLEFYYKCSLYETLYYPAELGVYGNITALTFYNNFVTNLPNMPCIFWLGQTNQADLSAGWITSTDLTQVYSGNINFPSGVNTITIPLQTPFTYTSGNLVLMAKRPLDTVYYNTNDNFRAQTVGANRARKVYSDTVDYDPTAPQAVGTLSGTFPMTSFSFVTDGFAVLNGTVTSGGNPVAGVDIVINTTTYATTTNPAGMYNFPFVIPGAYTVTASKIGFESQTLPVTLIADETTTLNFTLTASTSVTVSGTVTGSDQPTVGLADASVSLTGIVNYSATTNATGQFTIPGVLSGNAYSYVISKEGYQDLTGTVNVGATDYNMGTLILNEIALPPVLVEATENIAQTQVTITWRPPGAAGGPLMDFELDDGGWIPSSNWTDPLGDFEWTNTYNAANYVVGGYPTSEFPPPTAHSGTGLWGTVLYAPYTNAGGFSYLTKEFNFTGIASPQLRFWSWNNSFGNWDYGQVAVNGNLVWGPDWDTTPVEWLEVVIDLSAYAGMANVTIQFQHYTTTVVNYAGWYIDDVYAGAAQTVTRSNSLAQVPLHYRGLTELDAAALEETTNQTLRANVEPQHTETRILMGYKVWRLLAANQNNEAQWNLITTPSVTDTTFIDTAWAPLPSGVYKFAVKAVYTNDVLSTAAFSNEIHKGMMGVLSGSVTEFGTNVPVAGATITAGDYEGTSNAAGSYSFLVYQGTYEVTCSKPGYQTAAQAGVVIVGTQTTNQNFVLTEITLPPTGVQAEESTSSLVNITWMSPGTGGGEWIHYDSGQNNDSIGTGAAADFDVAIRYPASALTDYVGMSLYALKLWPAQAGTFSARVWTGGSPTAPLTMVVDQAFTPAPLDSYNTVVLNTPVAITGTEELWFGYRCNVTGGYPAGCDAGPAIDGFGNMMYYQGAWSTLLVLAPTLDYNWNIQGYVGYSAPTAAPLLSMKPSMPALTDESNRFSSGILQAKNGSGEVTDRDLALQPDSGETDRTLTGYRVWRLQQGQESNETAWISLTPNPITATAWQDTGWGGVADGTYKWSVKAIYTGGALSIPAFSNAIPKITQIGTIAGIVRTLQNAPISGATITCGTVTATTNASGAYSMQIVAGTWSVTASHPNYQSVTQTGVVVVTGQTTTANFQLPPSANALVQDFEGATFPPTGWTQTITDTSAPGTTGVYPTWCRIGTVALTPPVAPHGGAWQAGLWWSYNHQDEWLISPQFLCPTGAQLNFWSYVFLGSVNADHYYVKVSTNNGSTWTTLWDASAQTGGWNYYANVIAIPLTAYAGQQIKLAWHAIDGPTMDGLWYVWFIDDVTVAGTATDDPSAPVIATELHGNYPNPFNPETTIRYSVKTPEAVSIGIYNVKGQLVRTLVNEAKEAGNHSVVWNGRDNNGSAVSSGVYFFKMNAGKYSSTKKMIMMK